MRADERLRAGLGDRAATAFFAMLVAGLAIRLSLAGTTAGVGFDLESFRIVAGILRSDPFDVYAVANEPYPYPRWPYPPGYFPWLAGLGAVVGDAELFRSVVRLPAIAADLALAWLVVWGLGMRGVSERARLAAGALVALGPAFFAVSGYHGQLDAVAILPAFAALLVWEHSGVRNRALAAGVLIGLGAALKTVPGVMLFALLPSVRSRREAVTLVSAAVAVPLAALAPFVLANPGAADIVVRYRGSVGLGGLSLLAQPRLPLAWFDVAAVDVNGFVAWLREHGTKIMLAGVLAAGPLLARARTRAVAAAAVVWLVVYLTIPAMFMQYFVWGIPFFLLAGHLAAVAALQVALVGPLLVTYVGGAGRAEVEVFYVAAMLAIWAAFAVALALASAARWSARSRPGLVTR